MSSSGIGQFIPLILIFVIFYFFLIRPQQKKVKLHREMINHLKRGDKIITSGGIFGIVEKVMDNDKAEAVLLEKEIGVSPGQACVFYSKNEIGDKVLGGGWIDNKYL